MSRNSAYSNQVRRMWFAAG